ncbi:MAG: hypothetical protein J5684_03660 [Eubacterium sp.]|nr:hypothetical protein [Eubacterium sp.]
MASFIASGLVFLVSVALFFLLDIPKAVGELSGRTAKKSIQKIQEHNKNNSGKLVHSSDPNSHVTKPSKTGRVGVGTEKFKTSALESKNSETTVLVSNETTILTNNNETTILVENSASVPAATIPAPATAVAGAPAEAVATANCEVVESLASYMENELIE